MRKTRSDARDTRSDVRDRGSHARKTYDRELHPHDDARNTRSIVRRSGSPAPYTDLQKVLSDDLGAVAELGARRAALRVAVQGAKQTRAKAHALLKALRVHIVDQYGAKAAPVLDDFGYSLPAGPSKLTVAAKSQAVGKQRATRTARHTMGTNQKKAIKGAGPAVAANAPATPASAAK